MQQTDWYDGSAYESERDIYNASGQLYETIDFNTTNGAATADWQLQSNNSWENMMNFQTSGSDAGATYIWEPGYTSYDFNGFSSFNPVFLGSYTDPFGYGGFDDWNV